MLLWKVILWLCCTPFTCWECCEVSRVLASGLSNPITQPVFVRELLCLLWSALWPGQDSFEWIHVCVLCWAPHLGAPGEVSAEQSRGAQSLPSSCWLHCFWCNPGLTWASSFSTETKGTNLWYSLFSKRDFSWAVYLLQCNTIKHACLSQHNNI